MSAFASCGPTGVVAVVGDVFAKRCRLMHAWAEFARRGDSEHRDSSDPDGSRPTMDRPGVSRERKFCWLVRTLNFPLTRLAVPWDSWGLARPDANVADLAPMRRMG